ncbi:NACHT, LRR and PYD domains-containing protein 1a-like isoform X2 [Pyxicephalus adspersus]|uniref:NACHT, LRR and PYD domains-containing protein 1a-like isoform X2 n=1 Tax=Pyxicephalus adspersus TaxID=30357 RepID=UPI003B5C93EB
MLTEEMKELPISLPTLEKHKEESEVEVELKEMALSPLFPAWEDFEDLPVQKTHSHHPLESTSHCKGDIKMHSNYFDCKLCGKAQDPDYIITPVNTGSVYKLKLESDGLYRCSETGIMFKVTRPVTIEYELDSWIKYATPIKSRFKRCEILGPLFNIKTNLEPGVVSAVYLPHSLCIRGFKADSFAVVCVHIQDENLISEKPTKVEPHYAVVANPNFSALGVLMYPFQWVKNITEKFQRRHGMVLLYWKIIGMDDPIHRKYKINLYLMPHILSIKKDIENDEKKKGFYEIHKPTQTKSLYIMKSYDVCLQPVVHPKDIANDENYIDEYLKPVCPKMLEFRSDYLSGPYPYTEINVYSNKAQQSIQSIDIHVKDKEHSVWQANIDRGDIRDFEWMMSTLHIKGEPSSRIHIVLYLEEKLIQTIANVKPVVDALRTNNLLTHEQCANVLENQTSQEKMRKLFKYVRSWGTEHLDILYEALRKNNGPVIRKLEDEI